jgi:hypothetical protein
MAGAAVSAWWALIIFGYCIFGFHGEDKIGRLVTAANPYPGIAGAVIGFCIFFRSPRKTS